MSVQNVSTNPIIIGLTGGIASGKSTAAHYFQQLNIPVIDSDEIVKELWESNQEMIEKVEGFFHLPVKTFEDRKKLGHLIFHNEEKRVALNQIVHPYVFDRINQLKNEYHKSRYVVIDMPLLIEVGYQELCDYILVVYVDLETQIERLVSRDGLDRSEAIARIHAQLLLEEKIKHADVVLNNNGTVQELHAQIDDFLRGI